MGNQTSLKQMIQGMALIGPGVVEGTVTNVAPLEITLANDAKMILSANSLIVPKHLTDHVVDANIIATSLKSKITLYMGLKVGESVYLIFYNNGKKYFVLDRKG